MIRVCKTVHDLSCYNLGQFTNPRQQWQFGRGHTLKADKTISFYDRGVWKIYGLYCQWPMSLQDHEWKLILQYFFVPVWESTASFTADKFLDWFLSQRNKEDYSNYFMSELTSVAATITVAKAWRGRYRLAGAAAWPHRSRQSHRRVSRHWHAARWNVPVRSGQEERGTSCGRV